MFRAAPPQLGRVQDLPRLVALGGMKHEESPISYLIILEDADT
jgi:hypothetical protein